jgi:hypothetical protein
MMAEIENVVAGIVSEDATVAGLIGTRIEPDPLTATTFPAVTFKVVSKPRRASIRASWARIQFTVWAEKMVDVQATSTAIRKALEAFDMGVEDGVSIIQITYLNQADLPDPKTGRRTRPMDFQVLFREE